MRGTGRGGERLIVQRNGNSEVTLGAFVAMEISGAAIRNVQSCLNGVFIIDGTNLVSVAASMMMNQYFLLSWAPFFGMPPLFFSRVLELYSDVVVFKFGL